MEINTQEKIKRAMSKANTRYYFPKIKNRKIFRRGNENDC